MKRKPAIQFLLFTNALILVSAAMLDPIYAVFVEGKGGGVLEAGSTAAAFAFMGGITSLLSGKLTDATRKPKLIIAAGYIMTSVGFLLMLFAKSVAHIVLIQAMLGFADAFYSPAFDALYGKSAPRKGEGSAWALWESLDYFTSAAGAFVGSAVVSMFGFSALFIMMSSMAGLAGILMIISE